MYGMIYGDREYGSYWSGQEEIRTSLGQAIASGNSTFFNRFVVSVTAGGVASGTGSFLNRFVVTMAGGGIASGTGSWLQYLAMTMDVGGIGGNVLTRIGMYWVLTPGTTESWGDFSSGGDTESFDDFDSGGEEETWSRVRNPAWP